MRICGMVTCLVLVCLVALLTEKTEGHIAFFSPKDMMLMKEREGKKDMEPRSEDGQFQEVTIQQQVPEVEHGGNPDRTVGIAVRLSTKQLDHVAPVLEEIIHEIVEEN